MTDLGYRVLLLRRQGKSQKRIRKELGCSLSVVTKYSKMLRDSPGLMEQLMEDFERMTENRRVEAEDKPGELWKPVPGFGDKYEVSNLGRVRSVSRLVVGQRPVVSALLKVKPSTRTLYCMVTMSTGSRGKSVSLLVHRTVAELFIGPRPQGATINHKDGDKNNNRCDNLEYVSQSDNCKHFHSELCGKTRWGVYKRARKWIARIRVGGQKKVSLGHFHDKEEAYEAYALKYQQIGGKDLGKYFEFLYGWASLDS